MRLRGVVSRCFGAGLLLAVMSGWVNVADASTDTVVPPGRQPFPLSIMVGPDKNLWFTEMTGEKIGRVTTSGVTTEFSVPGLQGATGIAAGPDGNIWFTDQLTGKIEHINPS